MLGTFFEFHHTFHHRRGGVSNTKRILFLSSSFVFTRHNITEFKYITTVSQVSTSHEQFVTRTIQLVILLNGNKEWFHIPNAQINCKIKQTKLSAAPLVFIEFDEVKFSDCS